MGRATQEATGLDDAGRTDAALALLGRHDAARVPHPGGTLLAHLVRTHTTLRSWGAAEPLALAGLCHALYGTDGFAHALVALDRRADVAAVIGADAEEIVYTYASCTRAHLYPQLGIRGVPRLRDRFTGRERALTGDALRAFVELTFANELDLVRHHAALGDDVRRELTDLFSRCEPLVSEAAFAAFTAALRH